MMKKLFALFLVAVLVFGFAACGNSNGEEENGTHGDLENGSDANTTGTTGATGDANDVIVDYLNQYGAEIEAAMAAQAGEGGRAEVIAGQGNEMIFMFFFGPEDEESPEDLATRLEETLDNMSSFFETAAGSMREELDLDYMRITVQYYDQDENQLVARTFDAD